MLVNELRGMAIEREPRIEDIRRQLIHVGGIIARSGIDEPLSRALNDLMGVPFLPKRTVDGTLELVSVQDDFAILDHDRFGAAFADHYVLLNFERNDVQILDTMFKYMSLTRRYLSVSVKERSTVSEDAVPSEALGQSLQAKAYALFWYVERPRWRPYLTAPSHFPLLIFVTLNSIAAQRNIRASRPFLGRESFSTNFRAFRSLPPTTFRHT